MTRFETFLAYVLEQEGGYVDDPADRGGKTKYGITERVARAHGYRGDMRYLPLSTAKQIYRDEFWDTRLEDRRIHVGLAHLIFDMNINHGRWRSGIMTQTGLVNIGYKLRVDGVLGSQSFSVLRVCGYSGFRSVLAARRLFYSQIVQQDPSQRVFLKGWLSRCDWFERHYRYRAGKKSGLDLFKRCLQGCFCCFPVCNNVDESKMLVHVVEEMRMSLGTLEKRLECQQEYCEDLEKRLAKLENDKDAA